MSLLVKTDARTFKHMFFTFRSGSFEMEQTDIHRYSPSFRSLIQETLTICQGLLKIFVKNVFDQEVFSEEGFFVRKVFC